MEGSKNEKKEERGNHPSKSQDTEKDMSAEAERFHTPSGKVREEKSRFGRLGVRFEWKGGPYTSSPAGSHREEMWPRERGDSGSGKGYQRRADPCEGGACIRLLSFREREGRLLGIEKKGVEIVGIARGTSTVASRERQVPAVPPIKRES